MTSEGRGSEGDHSPRTPRFESGVNEALRRCIGVSPAEFATAYWGNRALLTRAAELASGFQDLLSPKDVDELLSARGLRTPFLRVAKDGTIVAQTRFTGSGGAGATIADQVIDEKVLALFAEGSTVVLQGLHRTWPPIQSFATALANEIAHPVQVNAYITPPQSRGFSAHYDVHDVFVLQVFGTKRWTVHEPVRKWPLSDEEWTDFRAVVETAARETSPMIDTDLCPGDSLYLPRGWLHAAEAREEMTIHLTVGVPVTTRWRIVRALITKCVDEVELRESLPLGVDLGDPAALEPIVAETVKALSARISTLKAEDVADQLRSWVWPSTRPAPIAPLAQAAVLRSLDAQTAVSPRVGLRWTLHVESDGVVLELPGRRVSLPQGSADAVRVAMSGPCTAAELPGLDDEDRLTLVRQLLREGALVPGDPQPGS